MILNRAQCDYLTLTTFGESQGLLESFRDLFPTDLGQKAAQGGYNGVKWEGLFFGSAKQKNRAHFMLRASGENAHTMLYRTKNVDGNCTRIDLQITISKPTGYNARQLFDRLSDNNNDWNGRRKNVSIIQSGDGLDTVYIGSRSSERFYRIYVKPDESGSPAFLRFEIELKKSLARQARTMVIEDEGTAKKILASELNTLPAIENTALERLKSLLGDSGPRIKHETVYGENKTIDWIENQVEPAVIRLLHSHEHGDRMLGIIERWLRRLADHK